MASLLPLRGAAALRHAAAGQFAERLLATSSAETRREATAAATLQLRYSADDWLYTILQWEARALDRIIVPWGLVMGLTCLWTIPIMVRRAGRAAA
jgi:hypothetical protein